MERFGELPFRGCFSLIEIINKSSREINEDNWTVYGSGHPKSFITDESESHLKCIGDYVFYDDGKDVYFVRYIGNDTEIILPEYEDGKEYEILEYSFFDDDRIRSINISANTKYIPYEAFNGCDLLTNVVIGNYVTSIGECAFWNCRSLTSIEISNSVTRIGGRAFAGCDSLTSIVFEGTIEEWNAILGYNWNLGTGNYTVYCSDAEITKDGTVTYK